MKKILLNFILFIAVFTTAKAQKDFCADITKTTKDGQVIYESPTPGDKEERMGKYGLIKVVDAGGSHTYFKLGDTFTDADLPRMSDITLTFEDNEVLTFTDQTVKRTADGIKLQGEVYYLYSTLLPLSSEQLEKIKTKKLKFHNVFGKKRYPGFGNPKEKLMAYATCLETLKPDNSEIDPCKLISKRYDDMKGETIYSTPSKNQISAIKVTTGANSASMITFRLFKDVSDYTKQMLYVKFDDGSVARFSDAVECNVVTADNFSYTGKVILTAENIKDFKEKKVAKFQMANKDAFVDDALSVSLKTWINCFDNLK